QQQLPARQEKPATLFITMGEGENGEDGDTTNAPAVFNNVLQRFSQKWAGIITVHSEIYPGLHHMETAAKTFEDELRAVIERGRKG
ncbi:MAG TPA: hypothetical protein VHC50_03935, partial [Puia sp.]|nr:hypothetical protein [Puia sp.]